MFFAFSEQNVEQPWFKGLVGTRFNQTGANGQEIQSEYYVPYSHRIEAIQSVSFFRVTWNRICQLINSSGPVV